MYCFDNIIKKPRLTEKGQNLQKQNNQIVFSVCQKSNKVEIKFAIEKMFNVKVKKIQTSNVIGKTKRVGKHQGQTKKWKKAIITLSKGSKIDFVDEL